MSQTLNFWSIPLVKNIPESMGYHWMQLIECKCAEFRNLDESKTVRSTLFLLVWSSNMSTQTKFPSLLAAKRLLNSFRIIYFELFCLKNDIYNRFSTLSKLSHVKENLREATDRYLLRRTWSNCAEFDCEMKEKGRRVPRSLANKFFIQLDERSPKNGFALCEPDIVRLNFFK